MRRSARRIRVFCIIVDPESRKTATTATTTKQSHSKRATKNVISVFIFLLFAAGIRFFFPSLSLSLFGAPPLICNQETAANCRLRCAATATVAAGAAATAAAATPHLHRSDWGHQRTLNTQVPSVGYRAPSPPALPHECLPQMQRGES